MLAVVGGSGLYHLQGIEIEKEWEVETPFGKPSAPIIQASCGGESLFFLPRHGKNHQFLPHEINYRANIFAFKKLGVKQILGLSAVGSLRKEIKPGDFAIPSQYFDWVKGERARSFFGNGVVAHISTAQPTCPNLTQWVVEQAQSTDLVFHTEKTYACVDGPRLGTRAESHFMRTAGCDLVGMTNVPEAFLAREAQICYATIGVVTDYDCWMKDPTHHVTVVQVIERYGECLKRLQQFLVTLLAGKRPIIDEQYRQSLKYAFLTPEEAIPEDKKELIEVLKF